MRIKINTLLVSFMLALSGVFFSNTSLGQYAEEPLAIDQQKIELTNELQSRITYVNQTLASLENSKDEVEQLSSTEQEYFDQLETSLKIYKNSLISKKALIPTQPDAEWNSFQKETAQWCKNVEMDLAQDLEELEYELAEN